MVSSLVWSVLQKKRKIILIKHFCHVSLLTVPLPLRIPSSQDNITVTGSNSFFCHRLKKKKNQLASLEAMLVRNYNRLTD